MSRIRIVATPLGEAPLWVREAWIGLDLPTVRPDVRTYCAAGVVSGPKSLMALAVAWFGGKLFPYRGYTVSALKAVEVLEAVRPDAAKWWRENTPHLMHRGQAFVFDEPACQPLSA
jgi:hypothetical protein